jgi:hypothetical protein
MAGKSSASAIKPLKGTTPRTIRVTAKIANAPTAEDAPLSQQPPLKKRLGEKLAKI